MDCKITWNQFKKTVYVKSIKPAYLKVLDRIAAHLGAKAYVYLFSYSYGENIYEKGKLKYPINIPPAQLQLILKDFKDSEDPLGMVVNNFIEVYHEKTYSDNNKKSNYQIPVTKIFPGELLGTFGTCNYLTERTTNRGLYWNISSGSRSLIAVMPNPWAKGYGSALREYLSYGKKFGKKASSSLNFKLNFYKCLQNFPEFSSWTADLVFFPSWWYEDEKIKAIDQFKLLIFQKGWEQSRHIHELTTDESFFNEIVDDTSNFDHLNSLFNKAFILGLDNILQGKHMLLKPVGLHPNSNLASVESQINRYFDSHNSLKRFEVVLYEFDYLTSSIQDDWGFISLSFPQINGQSTAIKKDIRNERKEEIAKALIEALMNRSQPIYYPYKNIVWARRNQHSYVTSIIKKKTQSLNKIVKYMDYKHFNAYIMLYNDNKS